jgi:hypothetical protein
LNLMGLALLFHDFVLPETFMTVAGVLSVAAGHVLNLRAHHNSSAN